MLQTVTHKGLKIKEVTALANLKPVLMLLQSSNRTVLIIFI